MMDIEKEGLITISILSRGVGVARELVSGGSSLDQLHPTPTPWARGGRQSGDELRSGHGSGHL